MKCSQFAVFWKPLQSQPGLMRVFWGVPFQVGCHVIQMNTILGFKCLSCSVAPSTSLGAGRGLAPGSECSRAVTSCSREGQLHRIKAKVSHKWVSLEMGPKQGVSFPLPALAVHPPFMRCHVLRCWHVLRCASFTVPCIGGPTTAMRWEFWSQGCMSLSGSAVCVVVTRPLFFRLVGIVMEPFTKGIFVSKCKGFFLREGARKEF